MTGADGRAPGGSRAPGHRPLLGVVVPAHDEQDSLAACLEGLRVAGAAVSDRARVAVLVVLDACRDRSESVARRHGVGIVRVTARNVGGARAAGAAALLARHGGAPVWLASTDADSVVGPGWLSAHRDAWEQGWDALVGTVEVTDWTAHRPSTASRYARRYARGAAGELAHRHVHGANLGVRASAYRAVGGYAPLVTGEDVDLVARLDATGHRVRRDPTVPVVTSARLDARAPAGFAGHLRELIAEDVLRARTVPVPVGG
jgi:GT2 family glycosyltransferase